MKAILYTIFSSLVFCQAIGQTPITIASFVTINPGKIDSCNVPTPAALSALPVLNPVINATWDLGSTALQTMPVVYAYKAKTSGFSTASFADSLSNSVSSSASIAYASWRNIQQSSTGVRVLGEEVLKRQARSIGTVTGNSLDSFIIPTQVMAYSNNIPILSFPATMSSKWSVTALRTLNFNLTVTAAAMNNTPGQHKQIITSLDSVVGWGKMRVPIVGKAASAYIGVLQIRHTNIVLDSFFLNGSPASSMVLTPLGLSQGSTTTTASTYFYRANAFRPLIEAVHTTASHSSTATRFYLHAIELPEDLGVGGAPTTERIHAYPNPVVDGRLYVVLPNGLTSDLNYSLINMAGQQMASGSTHATGGQPTQITLPAGLSEGIYYLQLCGDQTIATLPINVE